MINIIHKEDCCGCSACVQVCPIKCISFESDIEGFLYPHVDHNVCINCGLCERVCPVLNQREPIAPVSVLASINSDEQVRSVSTSGGIYSLLAEKVIVAGGIVFGAKFNQKWEVVHSYVNTHEELQLFRGSKYSQSLMSDNYTVVKEFLKKGYPVLFSGVPCQIAGLKNFLRKDYENLITVDTICHGVPSPLVWAHFLTEYCRSHDIDVNALKKVNFRDKTHGWEKYHFLIKDLHQHCFSECFTQTDYAKAFLDNISIRPSCSKCPAKSGKSGSDITLGDFWGINHILPHFNDNHGVGLVIINTQKGKKLFDRITSHSVEVKLEDAIKYNPSYTTSSELHQKRDVFFSQIQKGKTVHQSLVKVYHVPLYKKVLNKIVRLTSN